MCFQAVETILLPASITQSEAVAARAPTVSRCRLVAHMAEPERTAIRMAADIIFGPTVNTPEAYDRMIHTAAALKEAAAVRRAARVAAPETAAKRAAPLKGGAKEAVADLLALKEEFQKKVAAADEAAAALLAEEEAEEWRAAASKARKVPKQVLPYLYHSLSSIWQT